MSNGSREQRERGRDGAASTSRDGGSAAIGKRTLTEAYGATLRLKASGPGQVTGEPARGVAEGAMTGAAQPIPFRPELEQQFGVSLGHLGAYTGPTVQAAGRSLGASAFALGGRVAFTEASPARSTVAHEVAHALQQTRGGGAGDEASDEAEAHAAEQGAPLALDAQRGGDVSVRRQEAPQPSQDTPLLDPAASRAAIASAMGRRLPTTAWQQIAAVVGIRTTAIDDAMVQAIARWQRAQRLDVDGKLGDVTLQWMSSSPGGAGLDAHLASEPIAYMGVNPASRDTELSTLRATGAQVAGATGRSQQDTAVAGGRVMDLTTEAGREAYVGQFDRFDRAARDNIKAFLASSNPETRDELGQFLVTFYPNGPQWLDLRDLSRLDRMASRSLCTLRSQRRRWSRNTRYRLARYTLPGRSISCWGTSQGFGLLHASSSSGFVWRNTGSPTDPAARSG